MKRSILILTTLLIFTMMVGCQTSYNKPMTPDKEQTDTSQTTVYNNQAMVNKFVNLAEQVQGVSKAYVAISTSGASTTGRVGTVNNVPGNNVSNWGTNKDTTDNGANIDTSTANNMVVVVGLQVDEQDNTANMTNIEKMVEQKIKNSDSRISQVLVTTDSGVIKQINDINTAVKNGTPVANIQKSINDLTRSLTVNK